MSVNVYARTTKLSDVCGRVDYISNPERQENLMATCSTMEDKAFWAKLARDSEAAFRSVGGPKPVKGKKGKVVTSKCCQAREIVGDLPNSALGRDLNVIAADLAADFKARTGVECIVAIHLNKKKNNLHFHLIYSERELLEVPEIRIAERNAWIDEKGVRKRTKKEILGDDGQLRPGCRIVAKGEVISERFFGSKNPMFDDHGWLYEYKHHLASWINETLDPDEKRTVFDKFGPYLAQKHIGKGQTDKEEAIREWNLFVKEFNYLVKNEVIDEKTAKIYKTEIALAPDQLQELKAIVSSVYCSMGKMKPGQKEVAEASVTKAGKGTRDKEDPQAERKRKLRDAYRRSHLAWQKYRNTIEGSLERRAALAEARAISTEILRRERELGYDIPRSSGERRQAVWDAFRDQKAAAMDEEIQEQSRREKNERAAAWERYQNELKLYQAKYKGKRKWTPAREEAKKRLDEARGEYQQAKKKTQTRAQAYNLLQEYRSFALQMASDPNVDPADADRALDRYKAATRRLQEPTPENVREMRRQLNDLQRSQQRRLPDKQQQKDRGK